MKALIASIILGAALAAGAAPAPAQSSSWDTGVSLYNQKQYRQAIAAFQGVVDATPEFANTYFYLGMSHFFLKEYPRAVADLNRYVSLTEKDGKKPEMKARIALGRAYVFAEDYPNAVTALSIVTQTVTDDPVNFYYLAAAYQKLQKPEKAVEVLSAGLKFSPKNADMLDLLTRLLLEKAIASKAPADYQAAIARGEQLRLARDDAESAILLAGAYLASGDFAKASVHYTKVVAARPQDATSWFNYGLSLSRSKQFAKAVTALEKAGTLAGNNPGVWAELGFVEESLKNYAKALTAYERAFELNPDPALQEAIDRVKPFAKS